MFFLCVKGHKSPVPQRCELVPDLENPLGIYPEIHIHKILNHQHQTCFIGDFAWFLLCVHSWSFKTIPKLFIYAANCLANSTPQEKVPLQLVTSFFSKILSLSPLNVFFLRLFLASQVFS